MIVELQPGAPERELVILPDWLKAIVKAKGVPIGHGVPEDSPWGDAEEALGGSLLRKRQAHLDGK
jgi:hypothetical protein